MSKKAKHSDNLDLSKLDVRVRCMLRKLGAETIEKLLALTEQDISALKNCGSKTIAKIMTLQKEYGKQPPVVKQQHETIERAAENDRMYMNRLIIVAFAANELVEAAEKADRYYARVSRQRLNIFKGALEALRKQQQ